MAEQQLSARPRARSVVRRTAGGVTQISDYQPRRYTIIGDHLTQHRDLSLTAIGLGAHIQSLPDGAAVGIRTLAGKFTEGRERIAAALRELEDHGYLKRIRERTPEAHRARPGAPPHRRRAPRRTAPRRHPVTARRATYAASRRAWPPGWSAAPPPTPYATPWPRTSHPTCATPPPSSPTASPHCSRHPSRQPPSPGRGPSPSRTATAATAPSAHHARACAASA